ncbi:hypothetical protein ACFYWU_31390 [Streptomyces chrestomyceticus]|uniref:hypothetical protein n=1 Tax=Streptomyces chrestomyceticus TaxID=68185 RepID=UPI0036AD50F0
MVVSPTSGPDLMPNKPAGVVARGLPFSRQGAIRLPARWTAANAASADDGGSDTVLFVLKRTAGGSKLHLRTLARVEYAPRHTVRLYGQSEDGELARQLS